MEEVVVTDVSDESLWRLLKAGDSFSHSVLDKTLKATDAVLSHRQHTDSDTNRETAILQELNVDLKQSTPIKSPQAAGSPEPNIELPEDHDSFVRNAEFDVNDIQLDGDQRPKLETVPEEGSITSTTTFMSTNSATSEVQKQTVRIKLRDLKERKSPFEVQAQVTEPLSTPKALEHKDFAGIAPGRYYVTVEKHISNEAVKKEASSYIACTSQTNKTTSADTKPHHCVESAEAPGFFQVRSDERTGSSSSSSCQTSFDLPATSPGDSIYPDNRDVRLIRLEKKSPASSSYSLSKGHPANPQLICEDIQVKAFDTSARKQALSAMLGKQGEARPKSKYSVPVTMISNPAQPASASSSGLSGPSTSQQSITVQHELVASDLVKAMMERLLSGSTSAVTPPLTTSQEVKQLELKLKLSERKLDKLQTQMDQERRGNLVSENRLLDLLCNQQNLQRSQLLSKPSLAGTDVYPVQDSDISPLQTPAPRKQCPRATQPDTAVSLPVASTSFMQHIVQNYPSPVSPDKACRYEPSTELRAPQTASPARIDKRAEAVRIDKTTEAWKCTERELNQLKEKVQHLLDAKREEELQLETALSRTAPIDRYLRDIQQVKDRKPSPSQPASARNGTETKLTRYQELNATFDLPDKEASYIDLVRIKLAKLKKEQKLAEDNMATILSMKAMEENYRMHLDDLNTDEEARLRRVIRAAINTVESDVKKQVAQLDFTVPPLQTLSKSNTSTCIPHRYKSATERLKAIQAKIDTGKGTKGKQFPISPTEKENANMPAINPYNDEAYMTRVYGKPLNQALRTNKQKHNQARPSTKPIPYKLVTAKKVKSEKNQSGASALAIKNKQLASSIKNHRHATEFPVSHPKHVAAVRTRTVSTAITKQQGFVPTARLGAGIRAMEGDPTRAVFEVLPITADKNQNILQAIPSTVMPGRTKSTALVIEKIKPSTSDVPSVRNLNNNANTEQEGTAAVREDNPTPDTSEWQESIAEDSKQAKFLMTADSLELSAVTPAVAEGRVGQIHSTPLDNTEKPAEAKLLLSCTAAGKNENESPCNSRLPSDQPHVEYPHPRAWEEFADESGPKSSLDGDDRTRSDDITTPPTVLPGYRYQQHPCVQPVATLKTTVPISSDLFNNPVSGQYGESRDQWCGEPVLHRPLYDPTEMATRDWLEQRLMARCIERMIKEYPLRKPVHTQDPVSAGERQQSDVMSISNSLVAGALAEGGAAQVFITAGKQIDTEQVKDMMRQCLAEKIRTMLGTRETLDRIGGGDITQPSCSLPERVPKSPKNLDESTESQIERIVTPQKTPPQSSPESISPREQKAVTPEPSPPFASPIPPDMIDNTSTAPHRYHIQPVRTQSYSTIQHQRNSLSQPEYQLENKKLDQVIVSEENAAEDHLIFTGEQGLLPPQAATGTNTHAADGKLHLSQVSLWDTLSAAHTHTETVMDEDVPYETRYSIETPGPTPPSTPPQAVSVQTSLNEELLNRGLYSTQAELDNPLKTLANQNSRPNTPANLNAQLTTPANKTPRPVTPSRKIHVNTPVAAGDAVTDFPNQEQATLQQERSFAAEARVEEDKDLSIEISTVSETQMNTVSEGEWILRSEGQVSPAGADATVEDLSLASSDEEDKDFHSPDVTSPTGTHDYSEGEIRLSKYDAKVSMLAKKEAKRLSKSSSLAAAYAKQLETGEHPIIRVISRDQLQPTDSLSQVVKKRQSKDIPMRLSDLEKSNGASVQTNGSQRQSSSNGQSVSNSPFADSKLQTVKERPSRTPITSAAAADHPQLSVASRVITTSPTRQSPLKKGIPGMIYSTNNKRRGNPKSPGIPIQSASADNSTQFSSEFSKTRDSLDSPDRIPTESIIRTLDYTTSDALDSSHTANTDRLLARTIDTQGLSTGLSTHLLDTNKLLADTLMSSTDSQPFIHQRTRALKTEASTELNVSDSVDTVSSGGGILRASNEYLRSLSGASPRPKQYLRFAVPTADEDSSQASSDLSHIDISQ